MITLDDIKQHAKEPSYQFLMQTIVDMWENYIYDVRDLNDADADKVDLDDVGFFREWLDSANWYGPRLYLPQSDSAMQEIIKFCEANSKTI